MKKEDLEDGYVMSEIIKRMRKNGTTTLSRDEMLDVVTRAEKKIKMMKMLAIVIRVSTFIVTLLIISYIL